MVATHEVTTCTTMCTVRTALRIDTVVTPRQTLRVLAEGAVDATFASGALHASFVLGSGFGGLEELT